MYPCKKLPCVIEQYEEMFSENPKETPPLIYSGNSLNEPPSMAMYSDCDSGHDDKKLVNYVGDDYAYHPFYMKSPSFETVEGSYLNQLTNSNVTVPAPEVPSQVDVVGPIVYTGSAKTT